MIGENIRIARKEKGFSQRKLAELINSDGSYINRLETKKINPSIASMQRIANALDYSIDHLVNGKPDEAEVNIKDKNLIEQVKLIDSLDEDDKKAVTHIIDALLTKKRIRELIDGKPKD